MSQTQEVIDLTEDSSSPLENLFHPHSAYGSSRARNNHYPHFGRDVIAIDEQEDPNANRAVDEPRRGSPEVELLYSRPRLMAIPRPRNAAGGPNMQRNDRIGNNHEGNERHTDAVNGRPVQSLTTLAEWRARAQRTHPPHAHQPGNFDPTRRLSREILAHLQPGFQVPPNLGLDDDVMFIDGVPQIDLPGQLDFLRQGFAMGNVPQPQLPPPTYDAPASPRTGYTRSPTEDDMLVCPNCEEELGMGKDEVKKQVWVAKKCGHVSTTFGGCWLLWG